MRTVAAIFVCVAPACDLVFPIDTSEPGSSGICWSPEFRDSDEDDDDRVDGCDNCPAFPNPDQLNADGDDVGDACDAHPGKPDRIVYFNGFNTPEAIDDFNLDGSGQWLVSGGVLAQDNRAEAFATLGGERTLAGVTVETVVFAVSAPDDPGNPISFAGVKVSSNMDGESSRCRDQRGFVATTPLLVLADEDDGESVEEPLAGTADVYIRVSASNLAGRPECTGVRGDFTVTSALISPGPLEGDVVFETLNSTARYRCLVVVSQ